MFCWGEVSPHELNLLGLKDLCFESRPDDAHFVLPKIQNTDLSVGGFIAFLKENGKVTVAGIPDDQQGRRQGKTRKQRHLELEYEKIISLSCGTAHVVLISEGGKVLHWNTSDTKPRSLANLYNRQVVQVTCGNNHSIAVTKDGQLFTWGQNSNGQLGLGEGEPSTLSPQPLKSLSGIPVAQISAGGDHSFALSLSGAVFGWGKNSTGQLGLGDNTDRHNPVPVNSLNLKKTVFISCGGEHTVTLSKGGLVFTFGSGCYGQLGHSSLRDELRPRLVAELWGSKVSQIASGRHHTLVFVGSSRTIYSFGRGEQGQLGNGQRTNQSVPLPALISAEQNKNYRIERVVTGGNQSFALCTPAQDSEKASSNPVSAPGKVASTLDDDVISRWISDCDSKSWKKIQGEITRMFSSASCINGSFLEKRFDEHYQTSEQQCGLDMSLARLAFEKLAEKDKVLTQVEEVVQRKLLPSLSPSPAGVEGLRVYLILPELLRVLHKLHRGTDLTVAVAAAILRLHPDWFKVLEGFWSRLPHSFFRTLFKTFHSVSTSFLSQMTKQSCDHWKPLKKTLGALQRVYAVNSQRARGLKDNDFCINEITRFFRSCQFIPLMMELLGFGPKMVAMMKITISFATNIHTLAPFPCIFDMEAKNCLFLLDSTMNMLNLNGPVAPHLNTLHVDRQTLMKDTFRYLQNNVHNFSMPLEVKFKEEDGLDHGGLSLEFFTLFAKEVLSVEPKMVEVYEDSRLAWFIPDDGSANYEFYHLGIVFGMALINQHLVNFGFPLALFKKLLGLKPTLKDLEELSPIEARNLNSLLDEDEEVVEVLYLDFTVKGKELIPNGREVPVTKVNRHKYVDMYVDFVFNKSVKQHFEDFAKGFSRGCPTETWRMFHPEELMAVLYGNAEYKWEDLEKNAKYESCEPTEEMIQNFWQVFSELTEDDKKKFLSFVYGTDRLPIGGVSKLHLKIVKLNMADADDRYPVAHTCFGTLILPNYSSMDTLRDKLHHAITYCEVFGAQ